MVKQITGYKWNSLQAAQNAQNAARGYYFQNRRSMDGKPLVTTEYFTPEFDSVQNFYYFEGNISPVLGVPQTFNVNVPDSEL